MMRSIGLYTGARIINGISAIVLLSILTNMLSAEAYGVYSLLLTFSISLSTISYGWISVSIFRFNNPQSNHHAALRIEALRLNFFVCLLVGFLSPVLFYAALPNMMSLSVAITMATLTMLAGLIDLHLNLAISSGKPVKYLAISSGRSVTTLGMVWVAFLAGYQEIGALVAVAISYFMAALFGIYILYQPNTGRDPEARRRIIRYGLPLSVSIAAIIVLDFSDRYMLSIFADLREVGLYSSAYNLSQQTTGALLGIVFVTIFPRISGAYEKEQVGQVKRYAGMLLVLLSGLGGGILTGFTWYSGDISAFVLGQDIAEGARQLLPLVSLAIFLGALKSSVFDVPAKLAQNTGYLLTVSLVMAAFNIALNLILIPALGAFGAACATLLSFAAGMLISMIRYHRFWQIAGVALGISKLLVSLALMNGFIFAIDSLFSIPWMLNAFLAYSFYAGILFLLNPIAFVKERSGPDLSTGFVPR